MRRCLLRPRSRIVGQSYSAKRSETSHTAGPDGAPRGAGGSEPWGRCLGIFSALVVCLSTRLAANWGMNAACQAAYGIKADWGIFECSVLS